MIGFHAGGGYGVPFFLDLETGGDVGVGHGGVEQGVVDNFCEFGEGDEEGLGAGGCHGGRAVRLSFVSGLNFRSEREEVQEGLWLKV